MSVAAAAVPEPYRYVNIVDETLEGLIRSMTDPLPQQTPEQTERARILSNAVRMTVRQIVGFLFILDTVENMPAFGAMIAIFFDLVKVGLLLSAGMSTSVLPQLIGLIPLPLMGTVGTAIGWFISMGFLMAYASISFSRKEFSDTMRSILMMAPVVGGVLGNTFQSAVVQTGTKIVNRYEKLKFQMNSIWNKVSTAAVDARDQTVGMVNKLAAQQNVVGAIKEAAAVMDNVASDQPAPLPAPLPTPPKPAPLPAPPKPAPLPVPVVPIELNNRTEFANPLTPKLPRPSPVARPFGQANLSRVLPPSRKLGGKRFTRRRTKMSKWRKTRHHRKSKRR
jgi:hypothetical protein